MARKVLICDDEDVLRRLVRASLRERDLELLEAADGDEAVALARREEPDLILLDVMMPGRTGLQVLAALEEEPRLARIPVVLLSARPAETECPAALRRGVRRFLPKPFSPSQLAGLVDELLTDTAPAGEPS